MEETSKPTEAEVTPTPAPQPLRIHLLGSKALRTKSLPVGEITDQIRLLADSMVQTMLRAEGIGISACQVGVPICLIVVSHRAEILRLANPVVQEKSGEQEVNEGCLSLPTLMVKVKRSKYIRIEATEVTTGSKVLVEGTDLEAACIEHEMEHLTGELILDKLSTLKKSIYQRKLTKKIKMFDRPHPEETRAASHLQNSSPSANFCELASSILVETKEPDAYSLCQCGSGKKYKWCCRDGHTDTKEKK